MGGGQDRHPGADGRSPGGQRPGAGGAPRGGLDGLPPKQERRRQGQFTGRPPQNGYLESSGARWTGAEADRLRRSATGGEHQRFDHKFRRECLDRSPGIPARVNGDAGEGAAGTSGPVRRATQFAHPEGPRIRGKTSQRIAEIGLVKPGGTPIVAAPKIAAGPRETRKTAVIRAIYQLSGAAPDNRLLRGFPRRLPSAPFSER